MERLRVHRGEKLIYEKGDLTLSSVGDRAVVIVTNGCLFVENSIGDGARITTIPPCTDGSRMIVDFCAASVKEENPHHLIVRGTIGHDVILQAHGNIELHRSVGNGLIATARDKFIAHLVGEGAEISADIVDIGKLGSGHIQALHKAVILDMGEGSEAHIKEGSYHGEKTGINCYISAEKIFIEAPHPTSRLYARQKVTTATTRKDKPATR